MKFARPKAYPLACEAVEQGARHAVARLWKYTDPPKGWRDEDAERLEQLVAEAVMSELCERFDFD